MIRLNLPEYSFNISYKNDQAYIFDPVRKKKILLTPEEWVRQNFLQYLVSEKSVPLSLVRVEMSMKLNKRIKRSDIVVFDRLAQAMLIVECKAPEVQITQKSFDQAAMYNIELKVAYLVVTNGLKHYFCRMDYASKSYHFLKELPDYEQMTGSGSEQLEK